MCEMAGRGKPGDARNGAVMARTDGIGRGVLHGSLIGVAVLAGLSLAFPLRETAPVEGGELPVASVDPQPTEVPVPEVQAAEAAEENADTPLSEMQMGPPTGSEFARTEDQPPSLPASSSAPSLAGQVVEVALPRAESQPQPTGPATRPDTQDQTEAPQLGDELPLQVTAPAVDAAQPESQPNPARPTEPARDAGLAAASRAAPTTPDEAERTVLPGAETLPGTRLAARPEAPVDIRSPEPAHAGVTAGDMPAAQTGTEATSSPVEDDTAMESAPPVEASPQTTRPSAPVLEAPDPARETVPPPPAAADAIEERPAETAEPAASADTGEVLPEVSAADLVEAVPEPVMLPAVVPEPAPAPEPVVEQVAQAATEPVTEADMPQSAPAPAAMGYPAPDLGIPSLSLSGQP